MCPIADSGNHTTTSTCSQNPTTTGTIPADLETALTTLHKALQRKKSDQICAAYEAVRQTAMHMKVDDMFALAESHLKEPIRDMVVSAYSHRHCFMCDRGSRVCDQCHGAGLGEEDRPCLACEGMGVSECSFCGGTGWADRNNVPREILSDVTHRQLQHAREGMQILAKKLVGVPIETLQKLPRQRRLKLASHMMRIRARIEDLARAGAIPHADQKEHLLAKAHKLQNGLSALRVQR